MNHVHFEQKQSIPILIIPLNLIDLHEIVSYRNAARFNLLLMCDLISEASFSCVPGSLQRLRWRNGRSLSAT